MELADVLAATPQLRWFIGRVTSVDGATLTMHYLGGDVSKVGFLDQVSPVVGDVVHGLMWDANGFLVLGTNNKVSSSPPSATGAPVVLSPSAAATYGPGPVWMAGVLDQAPEKWAAWFYGGPGFDVTTLRGQLLASFEIEVTRTAGGPPEFFAHSNAGGGPGNAPQIVDQRWAVSQPPMGVPTWLPLPVSWGEQFVAGTINGFGIGGGTYTGSYSGTGRLRIVPLLTGR